jgi:proton-translocating NADH-quinone oxidoreductase chain N
MVEIPLILQPVLLLLVSAVLVPLVDLLGKAAKAERIREIFVVASFAAALTSMLNLFFEIGKTGPQSFVLSDYGPALGGVQLYADELSVFFSLLFCGLGLLAAIYSVKYMEVDTGLEKYYSLLLILVAGLVGVSFSRDFFNLYVFWEMMCISSYTLVTFRKYRWEPVEAGFKYLIMSTIGSLFALYGISVLYGLTGTLNFGAIASMMPALRERATLLTFYLIIAMLVSGFGVTAAVVPLHTWLPDAHPAAPSPISAMLSGVVIKAGVYAISRSLFTIFSPFSFDYGTLLMILGVLTMTIANLAALMQRDIKRLLAFSSIVNIGYILSGLGIGAYILTNYYSSSPQIATGAAIFAVMGALFHLFNHALGKGLLFLGSGCFVHELETRDISKLEGVGRRMTWTGISFSLGLLALAGVPPLSGFWSKLFIILAGFSMPESGLMKAVSIAIVVNSIFAASYYLWLMQRIMLKKPSEKVGEASEAHPLMVLPLLILATVLVVVGLWPGAIIQFAEGAARALLGG